MHGEIDMDFCEFCGNYSQVERTYFHYPIKCECHNNGHFVLIRHCKDCVPSLPTKIYPIFKAMDGKEYKATISNILPIKIDGQFIITKPVITY